jgi:hypothetical protein
MQAVLRLAFVAPPESIIASRNQRMFVQRSILNITIGETTSGAKVEVAAPCTIILRGRGFRASANQTERSTTFLPAAPLQILANTQYMRMNIDLELRFHAVKKVRQKCEPNTWSIFRSTRQKQDRLGETGQEVTYCVQLFSNLVSFVQTTFVKVHLSSGWSVFQISTKRKFLAVVMAIVVGLLW